MPQRRVLPLCSILCNDLPQLIFIYICIHTFGPTYFVPTLNSEKKDTSKNAIGFKYLAQYIGRGSRVAFSIHELLA